MIPQNRISEAGVAMLLALFVTFLILGIGSAYFITTLSSNEEMDGASISDEATRIAEAGLERTRRALYVYKQGTTTSWDDVLSTCEPMTIDTAVILDDNRGYFETAEAIDYRLNRDDAGSATTDVAPDLPAFFGSMVAYDGGAYHVVIRDNVEDPNPDPLMDEDSEVIAYVTALMPDMTIRQIQARLSYNDPFFSPDAAILSDGHIVLNGSPSITGEMGIVHSNANMYVQGNSVNVEDAGSAAGSVYLNGSEISPTDDNELYTSGAPSQPIPDVDVTQFRGDADFLLTSDGRTIDAAGNPVVMDGWTFRRGEWSFSGGGSTPPNGIYYVEGNVSMAGSGNSDAFTWTIMSTGSITATGNTNYAPVDNPTSQYKDTLFLANGDIKISGNSGSDPAARLQGFIGAHEQIEISGSMYVYGSLMAKDAEDSHDVVRASSRLEEGAQASGNAHVEYDGGLISPLEDPANTVKIKHERRYVTPQE